MTPKNLQEHMLRVAAISKIILHNWTGPELDKKAVTVACATHDIAKPMTFDITKQAQYGASQIDIANLVKLQDFIKNNYGEEEYEAACKMCRDIGVEEKICQMVKNLGWINIPQLLKDKNTEMLVSIYCDMRIGPEGILSLIGRIKDVKGRANYEGSDNFLKNGKVLEKEIQKNVSHDLNKISDQDLNSHFDELLNTEV